MDFGKAFAIGLGGMLLGVVAVIIGLLAIFIFAIIGAVMGAITGWLVSITPMLGDLVKAGFSSVFDIQNPDLVAIGAMLGFIAGFFKHWSSHQEGDKSCWE